jgi:serine protease Do
MTRTSAALNLAIPVMGALLLHAAPLPAQESRTVTSGVFQRYAEQIVKIEVVETGSAARVSLGTGFFVDDDGTVVTNYHVISEYVHDPERHRIELMHASGTVPLTVRAVDVVHDLAVLQSEVRPQRHFALARVDIAQGERLYSLGHPNDLGLSIVEGTFNGHLQHTLYPKIHFTGSINPGMSGGPTISDDGRVVGINVATSGEQVSFLVPVERAIALVERASSPGYEPPDSMLHEIGRQIAEYQAVYLDGMFGDSAKLVELGPYRAVTEPAPFFRCWGYATRERELPYERVSHRCSTDDYVFIAGDQRSGTVGVTHQLLTTESLSPTRFHSLYSAVFGEDNTPGGAEEHVTKWRCATRNVRSETTPMRAVLCLRRYRKLDALYDAVLKVAVLGAGDSGLVSTLSLSGVTQESIDTLSQRYLERITWR